MNRDGKGKMSLQIESHHQSSSSAVGYASGGKVSPPPQQVPLLGLGATGKRPAGIGTENVKQEIVMAERGENRVVLRVTLLAAGFVVGPNGASIHQIEAVSGAKVYSFNRSEDREVERPTRQFHIEGPPTVVQHAVDIICHAIQLYKDLAEGNHSGMTVKRLHKLDKVVFRYEPPPRAKVSFAAQVEYDAAELSVLQSTKGSRSIHAIREVRDQLARRDEALMRAALPAPARQPRYRARRGRGGPQIELGEPVIHNHDALQRNILEEFDSVLSITRTQGRGVGARSSMPKGGHLNVRAHQIVRGSLENIPTQGAGISSAKKQSLDYFGNPRYRQENTSSVVAKVSFGEEVDSESGAPPYQENQRTQRSQGRGGSQSGRWNRGGLYGIDSLVRDMSRLE